MVLKTTHIVFSCDLIAQRREALCFPSLAAVELRGSLEERQKIKHEARGCEGVPYTPKSTPCTIKSTPFDPFLAHFRLFCTLKIFPLASCLQIIISGNEVQVIEKNECTRGTEERPRRVFTGETI